MAHGSSSGPAGTGLIPPGVGEGGSNDPDPDPAPDPINDPDETGGTPPPDPEVVPSADDIDGVPPVPVGDGGDTDGGDGDDDDYIDPDAFREELLDEVQRRFDRAISRLTRRMGQPQSTGGGSNDGGNDGGDPPAPQPRSGRQVDTMSIRSYARGVLNDEMEGQGRQERQAIRAILDDVLEHTDWSSVDDEEQYVEQLVSRLASSTQDMIKIGSDRKVAQLRASGRLPQLAQQPGSTTPPTHSVQTGMAKGAESAKKRWPSGRRRMTG